MAMMFNDDDDDPDDDYLHDDCCEHDNGNDHDDDNHDDTMMVMMTILPFFPPPISSQIAGQAFEQYDTVSPSICFTRRGGRVTSAENHQPEPPWIIRKEEYTTNYQSHYSGTKGGGGGKHNKALND